MSDTLAGKVAPVTGASRGIGRAIAHKLDAAGCDIAANYYNSHDEAEELCAQIRAMGPTGLGDPGQGQSRDDEHLFVLQESTLFPPRLTVSLVDGL